jgi:hypothetical protein
MNNNELIIQETIKELDEIFNKNLQPEASKVKSDIEKKIKLFHKEIKKTFDCDLKKLSDYSFIVIYEIVEGCDNFSMYEYFNFRPKEQLAPLMLAGLKLAENLIKSAESNVLNIINWYEILSATLDIKNDDVYNFVLDKFKLEDNEQHREEFEIGFESISNSLYDITCESNYKLETESKFLEKFKDIEKKNCGGSWNSFIKYISSSALEIIKNAMCNNEVDEYFSQFDEDEDDDEEE